MTSDPEAPVVAAGRPIRLTPVKPGVWWIILGGAVAALGPMFGFLFGTMSETTTDNDLSPLFLYLFFGILIGGVGVLAVLVGVRRVLRDRESDKNDD